MLRQELGRTRFVPALRFRYREPLPARRMEMNGVRWSARVRALGGGPLEPWTAAPRSRP
jgi:hypothetical protein